MENSTIIKEEWIGSVKSNNIELQNHLETKGGQPLTLNPKPEKGQPFESEDERRKQLGLPPKKNARPLNTLNRGVPTSQTSVSID